MRTLIETAKSLESTTQLIQRFPVKTQGKVRMVNNPIPLLKETLKDFNKQLTQHYENKLEIKNLNNVAQAYLPNKSILTNAKVHQHSPSIIKFDFSHFYDDVQFEYFVEDLIEIIPEIKQDHNQKLVKRLMIDPETNGVTQGLPVSGALAGLALIPFWEQLLLNLPPEIQFTQYSDDLIFSYTSIRKPEKFNIVALTQIITQSLAESNRQFTLNKKKTCEQKQQFRKVTGVKINTFNKTTPSRADYRFLRSFAYNLSKTNNLETLLKQWGFQSKESFVGKISYMRSIDETGKINKLLDKYRTTFIKHNLFKTWLNANSTNPFL